MHINELTEDILTDNFHYWMGKLDGGSSFSPSSSAARSQAAFLHNIPTTHTWGDLGHRIDRYQFFLYEKILFQDRALLSKNQRRERGETVPETVGKSARKIGLEDYVFAFLGGHEPYYARAEFPAFGVFIRKRDKLESFPSCNTSRRDLASPETTSRSEPTWRSFLMPYHGRTLAEAESLLDPRHVGDPWHYWGSEEHWTEVTWQWKVEFHFRDRVELQDFAAILWPRDEAVLVKTRAIKPSTELTRGIEKFKRIAPQCAVVTYPMNTADQAMALVEASSRVARFYIENRRFPEHVGPRGEVFSCGK